MKLGGLFSGIGGFELAWQRNGGTIAWMCEIDPAARKVLEHRFPGVPIYPDVSHLDPTEVEPVDVLTGGSPCQGFSIAGARTGLEHVESRLFADYVRIMDGLAERGLRWAVWENVPGVLSITNDDGERTFPHVVAALVGADEPVRLDGRVRWNTGMAARGPRAVAWRVVDSRHFGVPQRRRRVYACVAFGGAAEDRAFRALLAKSEGVRGDSAACRTAREDVAGGVGAGVAGVSENQRGELRLTDVSRSVTSGGGKPGQGYPAALVPTEAACLTSGTGLRMDAETETLIPHTAGTLGANTYGGPPVDTDRMTFVPDVAHTLRGEGHDASEDGTGRGTPLVSYGMTGASGDESAFAEVQPTVTASHAQPGNVAVPTLMTMREGKDGGGKGPLLAEDESLTLATGNGQVLFEPYSVHIANQSSNGWGVQQGETHTIDTGPKPALVETYGVRRLTPVECERLQAFPDGWTEPAGSDSARYRALGNAVTVNVPAWLFHRITDSESFLNLASQSETV